MIALGVYITALIASNTLGIKIMPFLFDSHLSVGVFMFPIVFLMTDVVGEIYGKKIAKFFVLAGVIATALWILFTFLSLAMPWSPDGWAIGSYETVFGMSLRIAIASIVAFAIAEYQDVISFFFFKRTIGENGFWLRSTLSNLWSQFLDTVIFMLIAFVGIYETPVLISLIVTWWLYKVAMGFLYTPLAYLGIKLLKDKDGSQAN